MTIEGLGPSTIPASGRITVTGTVTNRSQAVWSELKVYPLSSRSPITTQEELVEQLDSPALGTRRTAVEGLVPDLDPGESATYTLRIPRRALDEMSGDPGVYWLGVQVLGTENGARADGADGRAQTLVTLMPKDDPPATSLALLMPYRARVSYDREGRVIPESVWKRALSDQGRFGRLLKLSRTARSFPLTWVVDPALLDVARAIGADNPGLALGPSGTAATETTPSPGEEPPEETPEPSPEALAVQAWLAEFVQQAAVHDVLALPYGDVDVAAAFLSSYDKVVEQATRLGQATLETARITSTPVVDPPDGTLPWDAINGLDPRIPVLLSDSAVSTDSPRVDVPNGPRLTITASTADDGLPGSEAALSAFSVRQRILAEAAVHALGPDADEPLVVQLPGRWDPGLGWRQSRFFRGLEVPWLVGTSAGALVRTGITTETIEPDSDALTYPDEGSELPARNFAETLDLIRAGSTLDALLPRTDTVAGQVARMGYVSSSGQVRPEAGRAALRTSSLVNSIEGLLREVTVSGPSFVTMSGEDGRFPVTITNGLDQPVTVGVRARVTSTDQLRVPELAPVTIPPGQRRTAPMHANSSSIGLWPVELEPVTLDGDPLGTSTEFKVRSSHVGQYIWGILGGGLLVLLVLIGFRVRRRVRARQATPGPLLKQDVL